jgi:uncharacterized protein YcfJ
MTSILPRALALAAVVAAGQAGAAITLFGHDGFHGPRVTLTQPAPDFRDFNFNDRASSVVVEGEPWEVCQDVGFRNRCAILVPGSYPNLAAVGLGDQLSSARPAHREPPPPPPVQPAPPQNGDIVFFEHPGFHGRSLGATGEIDNFTRYGFNDRATSVMVLEHRWEVCEHADFGGRCMILRPGQYPDLRAMGMNDMISSVRRVHHDARFDDNRYAPQPQPVYDWRRRPQEFVESVPIETVHVVYAAPQMQQQCWVEQSAAPANARTGGALVGGLIGGILGHQIGDGNRHGATVGGAVVGAVVGSQIARGAEQPQDVTRCNSVPVNQGVDHYDVSYWYHGVRHHVQTTQAPGPTIVVNGDGEPRL